MKYICLNHSESDTEVYFRKIRNGIYKSANVLPQDGLSGPPKQLKDDMIFQVYKDVHKTIKNNNKEINVICSIVLSNADLI